MSEYKVGPARRKDMPVIRALLKDYSLPTDGLGGAELLVALKGNDELVACGGLEIRGKEALLRSLAVAKKHQRKGIGSLLVESLIRESERKSVSELFLLTTSAARYFETRFGFSPLSAEEKNSFRGRVRESKEFQGACPKDSTLMVLKISPGSGGRERRATRF